MIGKKTVDHKRTNRFTLVASNFARVQLKVLKYQTSYPADYRKIAAVDSHNIIGIEKENIKKIDFCTKTFLSAIYFDVIS